MRTGEGMWRSVLAVNTARNTNGELPNGRLPPKTA